MDRTILRTVLRMLEESDELSTEVNKARANVHCARILIEEHLKQPNEISAEVTATPAASQEATPAPEPLQDNQTKFEAIVENGILKEVKNLDPKTLVLFNGKKMFYQDTIGKSFQTFQIL